MMPDTIAPTLQSLVLPSTIDLTGGSKTVDLSAGGSDAGGSGIDRFTFYLDHAFLSNGQSIDYLTFSDSADSFDDGISRISQLFDASTPTGTYGIRAYSLIDKAGNSAYLPSDRLAAQGLPTSFKIVSNASSDTTPPRLTSLSLPTEIDVRGGGATITAVAGATDGTGSGIDRVLVFANAHHSPTPIFSLEFRNSVDSFDDGASTLTRFVPDTTLLDTYDINDVLLFDKAGNQTRYSASQLAAMGIATSFSIGNSSIAASVKAPVSVTEGADGSFALSVTIGNVTNISGSVAMSLIGDGGATANDVGVPTGNVAFSTTGTVPHDYTFNVSPVVINDDLIVEPNRVVTIQLKSSGFTFADTGTDTTTVQVILLDGDLAGTSAADTLSGTAGMDYLSGGAGDDLLIGGAGADTLTGGPGNDIFRGTRAEMTSDRITDFSAGDKIHLTDVSLADVSLSHSGSTLLYRAGAIYSITSNTPGLRYGTIADGAGFDILGLNHTAGLSDFTGDGHTDILWRHADGRVCTWNVAGNVRADQVQQGAFNASVDPSWKIADTFDRNGDGRSDILWRNSDGELAIWDAQGSGFNQRSYLHTAVDTNWRIAGAGDITGDGRDDILWQNADGQLSAWTSTGTGFQEASYTRASVGASWKVESLGDFNGDGKADILWRNTDGSVAMWANNGAGTSFNEGAFFQPGVPTGWHIDGVGDVNGDGKDDLIWRNDNGALSIWRANGTGFDQGVYNTQVDPSWHIVQVGDFNGDGKADILWRNDNGGVSTWQSNGPGFDQGVYNSAAPTSWSVAAHDYIL